MVRMPATGILVVLLMHLVGDEKRGRVRWSFDGDAISSSRNYGPRNAPLTQLTRTKAARLFAAQGVSEMSGSTFSFSHSAYIHSRFIVF